MMKNNIEKIDKLIKETLSAEEASFYDTLKEPGLLEMLGQLYKGKNSWVFILMNVVSLVILGVVIYCIIRFLKTTEALEAVKWGLAIMGCFGTITMLKLYVWMQMDKRSILREIKRVELQVSVLADKKS